MIAFGTFANQSKPLPKDLLEPLRRQFRERKWKIRVSELEKRLSQFLLADLYQIAARQRGVEKDARTPKSPGHLYRSIKTIGIKDKDPLSFEEPWPQKFFPALEKRLKALQQEYESALRIQGIG